MVVIGGSGYVLDASIYHDALMELSGVAVAVN
jgi:hypothetical protein